MKNLHSIGAMISRWVLILKHCANGMKVFHLHSTILIPDLPKQGRAVVACPYPLVPLLTPNPAVALNPATVSGLYLVLPVTLTMTSIPFQETSAEMAHREL